MFNNKPTSRSDATSDSGAGQPINLQAPSPAPAPSSEPKRPSKMVSLLAAGMTIEGTVTSDGEFTVEGIVRGDIRVSRLTIGEVGQIEGSVTAESVECRGRVIGAITAKQVRLYASAHIDGDITHEQLAMETGAFFQGRSLKFQRPNQGSSKNAPAPAPETATATAPDALTLPAPQRA